MNFRACWRSECPALCASYVHPYSKWFNMVSEPRFYVPYHVTLPLFTCTTNYLSFTCVSLTSSKRISWKMTMTSLSLIHVYVRTHTLPGFNYLVLQTHLTCYGWVNDTLWHAMTAIMIILLILLKLLPPVISIHMTRYNDTLRPACVARANLFSICYKLVIHLL